MKIKYIDKRFNKDTLQLLESVKVVVDNYRQQGYTMTLRQLYYQLVSKDIIPNQQREYERLSRTLTDARMSGIIDWEFIEDRIRMPRLPVEFENLKALVGIALRQYRLPRWKDQSNYVEVWVEKDALSGVLSPITTEYHVPLLVNRGYSSATAMHDAALRFRDAMGGGKNCILLYLGDHDPSGEDMVRDIRERLATFRCNVEVRKLALTMAQITTYNPPPNPAKTTDTRSDKYIAQHGHQSWELDALPPDALNDLVKVSLDQIMDKDLYKAVMEQEEADKRRLYDLVDGKMENKSPDSD